MGVEPRHLEVTLQSRLESVDLGEELARQVAMVAGFEEEEQYRIGMAVREVVINALKHGNRGDERKFLRMGFLLEEDRLRVRVGDQGPGFTLEEVPDPLADENLLKSSGRGLFLVRCFMEDLRVEAGRNGGAVVSMSKRYSSNHRPTTDSNAEKEKQP